MIKDLTGQRFGRLTVIEFVGIKKGLAHWECLCDCGNTCIVNGVQLRRGNTKSCGCLRHENTFKYAHRSFKHGMSNSKLYYVWANMKNRCYNEKNIGYHMYGGRGIIVCAEWRDNFKAFYDYVSKLEHFNEEGYTLDRIDNNGNYEPGNVRWATVKERSRNQSKNIFVDYNGEKLCLAEVAEILGMKYITLFKRYSRGWRGEQLFQPVKS